MASNASKAKTSPASPTGKLPWAVTGGVAIVFLILALATLIGGGVLVAEVSGFQKNVPVAVVQNAPVFALVSAIAVAIERIIELGWTVIDSRVGTWWPLSSISQQATGLATTLSQQLSGFFQQARTEGVRLVDAGKKARDEVMQAEGAINSLNAKITTLAQAPRSDREFQRLVSTAQDGITFVQGQYPTLNAATAVANQAVGDLADIVNYLADNPGRRIISLWLGMLLGLLTAGVLNVDLVRVAFGQSFPHSWPAGTGVAITGLVLGLGSGPVHEVVRAIQLYKEAQKATA